MLNHALKKASRLWSPMISQSTVVASKGNFQLALATGLQFIVPSSLPSIHQPQPQDSGIQLPSKQALRCVHCTPSFLPPFSVHTSRESAGFLARASALSLNSLYTCLKISSASVGGSTGVSMKVSTRSCNLATCFLSSGFLTSQTPFIHWMVSRLSPWISSLTLPGAEGAHVCLCSQTTPALCCWLLLCPQYWSAIPIFWTFKMHVLVGFLHKLTSLGKPAFSEDFRLPTVPKSTGKRFFPASSHTSGGKSS